MDVQNKAAVSVAEMAQMVALSRQRFYQLIGTTFPSPVYDVATKRPFYTEELQVICLQVRRRNFGIDGRPVLFYARRNVIPPKKASRPQPKVSRAMVDDHADLIDGLRALGLMTATTAQVSAAMKEIYPSGVNGTDQRELLRNVFLHIRAQG
jgi:hypothetical protein